MISKDEGRILKYHMDHLALVLWFYLSILFSAIATFLSYCSFHRVLMKENVGEALSCIYLSTEC